MAQHPHLIIPTDTDSTQFTSPSSGPHERFSLPQRTRKEHAEFLTSRIEALAPEAQARIDDQKAQGIDEGRGIYLIFKSEPNFPLKFESLDLIRSGVELCAVKTLQDNSTQATVFVPDGKLELFLSRIADYRDRETSPRTERGVPRPKNQDLVESISDIQLAALEALWTEETIPFPAPTMLITWEVWLRRGGDQLARLREYAERFNLVVRDEALSFVDRTVVLVRATAESLSRSIEVLGMIAELRLPKPTAAFFAEMDANEQQEWVADLANRLVPPPQGSPFVCLLDTGLNNGHALLSPVADTADLHAYKPAWGVDDRKGHGSPMAGLSIHGDLTDLLASSGPVACTHRLESVKIFHDPDPNEPELYGAVTQESAYRVEVTPRRNRVFCLAVTAIDGRDRGRPSSWSAAVDAVASGADDGESRLFVVSAGNADPTGHRHYPESNMSDSIHDPAQAWNALTVGGYTEKAVLDASRYPGWSPLASKGDLAPCSCTSMAWGKWPVKPDIVMEAGNLGINPAVEDPDYIDPGLQLLSTSRNPAMDRPLVSFGDTSAAAALAARLAARAWAKYPNLRPETVRALIVHSAEWTDAMRARFTERDGSIDYRGLVRCFGYGAPNVRKLMSSLDNSLTLIAEHEIKPFHKVNNGVKTREMQLHPLPWPTQVLMALQNTDVTMRVTLSYFIEPSPGARGWTPRYGYQSHGLRFAVRKPLESVAQFERRINKALRDEDYENPGFKDPGWQFGWNWRSLTSIGCVHSDVWKGSAADLASRGYLAVFPTIGWWKKRQYLEGWKKKARYSLIVTIEAPEENVDIYTPVANQVGVPIVIET